MCTSPLHSVICIWSLESLYLRYMELFMEHNFNKGHRSWVDLVSHPLQNMGPTPNESLTYSIALIISFAHINLITSRWHTVLCIRYGWFYDFRLSLHAAYHYSIANAELGCCSAQSLIYSTCQGRSLRWRLTITIQAGSLCTDIVNSTTLKGKELQIYITVLLTI